MASPQAHTHTQRDHPQNPQIPLVAVSGLKIDSVTIPDAPYKPYKGVRAVTHNGVFQIRS